MTLATCKSVKKPSRVLVLAGFHKSLVNFRGPLIKALCGAGLEVHAAAPGLLSNTEVLKELRGWGIICHNAPLQRAGLNPVKDLLSFFKLLSLMQKIHPTFVLSYTIKPVIYGTLAAWLTRVPHRTALITGLGYAFSTESSLKGRLIRRVGRSLYSLALRRAELVFLQNPDDESLLRKMNMIPAHIRTVVVNGSGIDADKFQCAPMPKSEVSFLLIARLLGAKGVREYVEAAKIIRGKYPRVLFRLVGGLDDNPDSVSETEVQQWQEEGIIDYLGSLDDVRPAIENASVYVLPSYYPEGTPRTILEAMAMGRAVITTDSPGCRETVVDGENGFLVPIKSVQGLYQAMQKFIDTPELIPQMGKRSREIAEEKYDVHKVNEVMLQAMGISSKC